LRPSAADHTWRLFEKHRIKNIGYWTAVDEKHQGGLYYNNACRDEKVLEEMLDSKH